MMGRLTPGKIRRIVAGLSFAVLAASCSEDKSPEVLSLELLTVAAAREPDMDDAEDLIEDGANVNVQDEQGDTPLHYAADFGHVELAQLFILSGAELNQVNELGITPLFRAAVADHVAIAEMLLSNGADIDLASNSGDSPLAAALSNGRTEMVSLLRSKRAKEGLAIKGRMLLRQSFEVELPHFGEVLFTSYFDETNSGNFNFYLLKNGKPVYEFESFSGNTWSAQKIIAVAFRDVNGDEYKDVIIIAAYKNEASPDGMKLFEVPGIYLYVNRSYRQNIALTADLRPQGNTIRGIMEHVSNK
ncbi:MAG: ankyrin repeat domain-containing protein [Candidatus Marinimicrobia bacterium]|nr:ankyrin repeat domain-containing protein [Candidatus Neomarinimicrobiota bacterium]